jgi:MFS-type transporter involved in bile tolerance (Atg22 family)
MNDEYLGLFTIMSFTALSLGSVLLSILTRTSKGNRAFAIILAVFSIVIGLYVWMNVTEGGILAALFGASSLAIAIWPRNSSRQ